MLLKNLQIVTSTTLNDQAQNIRIMDGLITEIGPKLSAQDGEQVHDFQGAYVSPGWMDMHVHLRESLVCRIPTHPYIPEMWSNTSYPKLRKPR